MKKVFYFLFVVVLAFYAGNSLKAKDKPFKGKITYQISYDASKLPEGAESMMPKTLAMFVDENMAKTVLFTEMGKQSVIINMTTKTTTAMMDVMGKKFAIESTQEDIKKEIGPMSDPVIEFLSDTKEIAGYLCKKAKITITDTISGKPTESYAWFTEDLEVNPDLNFSQPFLHGLKGVLMEYELDTGQGFAMKFTAIEVEKKKVPESEFEVPADYQKGTQEDFIKALQGY